jgi:hypothetical protein
VVERIYCLSRIAPALLPSLARSLIGSEASSRLGRALEQRDRLDRFMNIFAGMDASTVDRLVPGGEIPVRELARGVIGRWVSADSQADTLNDLLRVDVRMALADDLLLIADHHSMRASVELRVPFLDLRFLDLAERMPSRYKISWLAERKWLYRQGAAARLPPKLRRKVCGPVARVGRKQGFAAPLTAWFAGGAERARVGADWASALRGLPELSPDVALELANTPDDGKHARRSVSLYALAQWADAYGPDRVASRG